MGDGGGAAAHARRDGAARRGSRELKRRYVRLRVVAPSRVAARFDQGGSMQIDITIANEDAAGRNYLTWAPVRGTVQRLDGDGGGDPDPVVVTVGNDAAGVGGQVAFAVGRDQPRSGSLDLVIPPDGT